MSSNPSEILNTLSIVAIDMQGGVSGHRSDPSIGHTFNYMSQQRCSKTDEYE